MATEKLMRNQTFTSAITTALIILTLGPGAVRADILYGATGGSAPSNLYILNPANGSVTSTVGPIGFAVTGLAFDPTSGVLYGVTSGFSATSPRSLITINTTTGVGTLVGPEINGSPIADITFTKNGTLYGWGEGGDDLYTINKITGTATKVGESGIGTYGSGISANPNDVLFYTGSGRTGPLRTIDKTTGLPTTVATLSGAPGTDGDPVNALAFNSTNILYGSIGTFGSGQGHLVIINTTTGVVTDLGLTVINLDAIAFFFALILRDNPEELSSIYQIGFSQATIQSINLQRRMDDIRAGSNGFSANGFVATTSGKDYSGGKGVSDGKMVLPRSEASALTPAPENRWGVFVTGTGQFINVDGADSDRRGYDITTGAFTLGADYRVCPNFAIGIDGGYARSTANLSDDGEITVDGGKIGMYATYFAGGFYLDGAASGGYNTYDTRRSALLGTATARGSTDGAEFNALAGIGYDWTVGCLRFGPTATFQYTDVSINSFTEKGSPQPLEIVDQDQESERSTVGMRAAYDWKIGRVIVRPEVRAAWKHEFGDEALPVDSRFVSGGNIFTVHGPAIDRDSALVGAGFAVQWTERVSTYAYYDGELGRNNYDSQNVSGGIRVNF